jgi:hypothetical protein
MRGGLERSNVIDRSLTSCVTVDAFDKAGVRELAFADPVAFVMFLTWRSLPQRISKNKALKGESCLVS